MSARSKFSSNEKKRDWKLSVPFQMQVIGMSQSGKSSRILDFINHKKRVLKTDIKQVIYVAPCALDEDYTYIKEIKKACDKTQTQIRVSDLIPTINEVQEVYASGPILLILDDATSFDDLTGLTNLSGVYSHHKNISVIYSLQNPFQKKKKMDLVSISRNLTARLLCYSPNDWNVYCILNRIIYPDKKNFIVTCLSAAKEDGLNYIFINTSPHTELSRKDICYTAIFQEKNNEEPKFFDL